MVVRGPPPLVCAFDPLQAGPLEQLLQHLVLHVGAALVAQVNMQGRGSLVTTCTGGRSRAARTRSVEGRWEAWAEFLRAANHTLSNPVSEDTQQPCG